MKLPLSSSLSNPAGFIMTAQAPGTQVLLNLAAVLKYSDGMDIRLPATVGMPF